MQEPFSDKSVITNVTVEMATPSSQINNKRTLQEAIAYDYDFTIGGIILSAWGKVKGLKLPFLLGILILSVTGFFVEKILSIPSNSILAPSINILIRITMTSLVAIFTIMALSRLRGEKVSIFQTFAIISDVLHIIIFAFILMPLLISAGFHLFILPGIYLSLAYCLTIPIIVDTPNITAWQAMEASRKIITKHWFKVFGLFFILGIILIISAIPFGIGLVWTLPLIHLSIVTLYQLVFEEINQ